MDDWSVSSCIGMTEKSMAPTESNHYQRMACLMFLLKSERLEFKTIRQKGDSAYLILRSISLPFGSINCTSSGILPTAWVAQLRQGSKARMTASTRLSMPSCNSRDFTYYFAT